MFWSSDEACFRELTRAEDPFSWLRGLDEHGPALRPLLLELIEDAVFLHRGRNPDPLYDYMLLTGGNLDDACDGFRAEAEVRVLRLVRGMLVDVMRNHIPGRTEEEARVFIRRVYRKPVEWFEEEVVMAFREALGQPPDLPLADGLDIELFGSVMRNGHPRAWSGDMECLAEFTGYRESINWIRMSQEAEGLEYAIACLVDRQFNPLNERRERHIDRYATRYGVSREQSRDILKSEARERLSRVCIQQTSRYIEARYEKGCLDDPGEWMILHFGHPLEWFPDEIVLQMYRANGQVRPMSLNTERRGGFAA
ncbi:MAG: hypothetical protein GMKNLPBB_01894 [Myxococcota bacterium]|nr:hypothetical protein [Myxococcota bacterium]